MAKRSIKYHSVIIDKIENPEIPREVLEGLGTYVARAVQKCFKKEENRKAFEQWYFEKYGKEYVWKTMKASDLKADSN